jgi:hypothetical protein
MEQKFGQRGLLFVPLGASPTEEEKLFLGEEREKVIRF